MGKISRQDKIFNSDEACLILTVISPYTWTILENVLQIYYRKSSKGKIKSLQARAAEQTGCLALEHALAIFSAHLVGNAVSVLARPETCCATGGFLGYRKAFRVAKEQLSQERDLSHRGDFGFTLSLSFFISLALSLPLSFGHIPICISDWRPKCYWYWQVIVTVL